MLDTLVHMVQEEWDFPTNPAEHPIPAVDIGEILRGCRVLDFGCALYALGPSDQRSSAFDIDESTGQVSISLSDLTGARREYGRHVTYYLWPDPPNVYVSAILVTTGFTWRPFSMSLEFATARSANAPVVIRGHLIDINKAYHRVGEMLVTKFSQLSNVKGDEFSGLAARTQKRVNHYKTRMLRSPQR